MDDGIRNYPRILHIYFCFMEKRGFSEFELVDDASSQVTDAGIKGVSSFLRAVCLPGLQELGYMIQDKVRYWRLNNVLRMLEKSKRENVI